MLDIPRIDRIRLTAKPQTQIALASTVLLPNYTFLPGVTIEFEHFDRVPDHPVIFAMNHTDRFNYWPFQYRLWRYASRYTATWVKGKYYESWFVGNFMEHTNNIPTVSRGYIITRDFISQLDRVPTDAEYKVARAWLNAQADVENKGLDAAREAALAELPAELTRTGHSVLGRYFDPTRETWAEALDAVFRRMMSRFVELNKECFDLGLDLLIFPQGTRSIRLSRGHIGIAEIALKYKQTIVPVGCSGSDTLYPGSSPFARKGRAVYRFGDPIHYEDMSDFHIDEDYQPFTSEAEAKYRDRFQGLVDVVMDRINPLLDPEYQYGESHDSEGVTGTKRFV